jgi:integrase
MKGTIRATVKIAGVQRERRFVAGTPKRVIAAWKRDTEAKLRKRYPVSSLPKTTRTGTFAADVDRYLPLVKHLADWVTRRAEIRHWLPHFGSSYRDVIRREDVLRIRALWVQEGLAAKTINNRICALRNLFRLLGGDDEAWTPCDGIPLLRPPKPIPQVVDVAVVKRVCDTLLEQHREYQAKGCQRTHTGAPGGMHALKDRARLMVMASTGKRPCEIARAQPGDVDLRRRVWLTRDAKFGYSPGCYLNDDMLAAWEAFFAADAWGPFQDQFARRLRLAGWPVGVKPYNVRHSTWIEASERGADLSDIQVGCGHRQISTTRKHYVPVLNSRMQRLSELLDGRFGWAPKSA